MKIYFRVIGATIYDEHFGLNCYVLVDKFKELFSEKTYGEAVEIFYPTIVLRDQAYYKLIEENPSIIKTYRYNPKIYFNKKDKVLQSYVEVHHEEVRKAKTIAAVDKIVAKAILESITNADKNAKQRIDFKQMEIDVIVFCALNGIPI